MYQKNFPYDFLKQDVSNLLFLIQYSYDIITLRGYIYSTTFFRHNFDQGSQTIKLQFNGDKACNMICLQGLTHDMVCIVTNCKADFPGTGERGMTRLGTSIRINMNDIGPEILKRVIHC